MAVRTVANWANVIVTPDAPKIFRAQAANATSVKKGSLIKMVAGVVTEVSEGEDIDFYGVAISAPELSLDDNYYVTYSREGQYAFAVDEGDTLTDYKAGYALMIGDNCQTVKLATVIPTPDIDSSIARVVTVDSDAVKNWKGIIYGLERTMQGDNEGTEIEYDIVVVVITPGV